MPKKNNSKIKRIAVLCSGGDGPGMNACIRAVVRSGIYHGLEVYGVFKGYQGLIDGLFKRLEHRSVSNIIGHGGTILKTDRCEEFMTEAGRAKAAGFLKKNKIDGLIVIGGNGSLTGAHKLYLEHNTRVIGVPGTIDNDITGSDYTIGADTAVNTALDAIDKIRDTVTSMERIFVVEVMGRTEPFISIRVGLAGGAEDILFPESEYDIEDMCQDIKNGRKKGKVSWIIIVSEGVASAKEVSAIIEESTGFEVRSVTLGHVQRGGNPTASDRILASRLGSFAVEALINGHTDKMVGIESDELKITELKTACQHSKKKTEIDRLLYKLTKILST